MFRRDKHKEKILRSTGVRKLWGATVAHAPKGYSKNKKGKHPTPES